MRAMHRTSRHLAPARGLALGFALALTFAGPSGAEPLATLAAPVEGTVLVAGELAWLAWEPEEAMAARPEIVEWEAFLSLDGGRSFPFRITPHLTIEDSRVLFRVPGFASQDVRLLLRFGDEREEVSVAIATRFEIRGTAGASRPVARWAEGRGESARPGEPGTVYWVEGDREGRDLRPVETRNEGRALGSRQAAPLWAVLLHGAPLSASPQLIPPPPAEFDARARRTEPPPRARPAPPRSRPLLSLHHRLNT